MNQAGSQDRFKRLPRPASKAEEEAGSPDRRRNRRKPLLEGRDDDGDVSENNTPPRKRRPHQENSQANPKRMHTETKSCVAVDFMQGFISDAPLSGGSKGI